jgi:hypothetical protein
VSRSDGFAPEGRARQNLAAGASRSLDSLLDAPHVTARANVEAFSDRASRVLEPTTNS